MYKIFALLFICITCNADVEMLQRTKVMMGTFVSLSVPKQNKPLLKPAFEIVENVDNSLSSFKENSSISKLNKDKTVELDAYAYEAVTLSLKYYQQTDGYFNIAIGKITKDLYRFGEKERLATSKELQKSSTSLEDLQLENKRAYINKSMKLDLGGMGKGFAVDKVNEFLKKRKLKKAVIALSGDIRCIGECTIAVGNPLDTDRPLAFFEVHDSGISTSGTYNRYIQSQKYNHLINPKTKVSQQQFLSVTLISKLPSATLDAYATAVSVMPKDKAYSFLASHDLAYIILQTDKRLVVSKNIDEYVKNLRF